MGIIENNDILRFFMQHITLNSKSRNLNCAAKLIVVFPNTGS